MIEFDIQTVRTDSIVEKYHYNSTDWKRFNECLMENFVYSNITEKMQVSDKTELDKLATQITNIFTATIKSNVKSTKNYKQRNLVSWWSNEISQLRKSVNKARVKYQHTSDPIDIANYRKIRNQYKNKIRASKSTQFQNYCRTAENPWALVKKLTSSYRLPCIPTLKKECGSYTTDDLDTCNLPS